MNDPFMRMLGLDGEITAPGQARVWGVIGPEHLNNLTTAHGGYLYTLADAAFALASNSHGVPAVALATHMEYTQAGKAGDRVEATAREEYLGYRTGVYRVEVRNSESLLAVFSGTVFRKQKNQEVESEKE
jgi:acyl-CoA thioesterase